MEIYLPLADTSVNWLFLILIGFGIGTVSGLFGVGGGFLLTPILRIFFDIPYPIAIGSGLLQIFLTSCLSAWKYWKNKNLDLKLAAFMLGGSLLGAETGVRIMKLISNNQTIQINGKNILMVDAVVNTCFLIMLSFVAIMTIYETSKKDKQLEPKTKLSMYLQKLKIPPMVDFPVSKISSFSIWIPIIISYFVGTLTGLLGIGGGFIAMPLMIYVIGIPTIVAVGTSAFQILFTSAYGAMRHYMQGNIEFILVFILLIGSLAGVNIGVKIANSLSGLGIRKYFALFMLFAIALILYDMYYKLT